MLMKTKKDLNKDPYYIAPAIKRMLEKSKDQVINKDWDRVFIIDGEEGSGKSLLGLQLGYYLDPTLNIDRIVFSGEGFSKAIREAKKNQCIIFDEAFNGLASAGAISSLNKLIVRKLMECRQKNLFIIIILPTIFELQKYAAIFRSKALFHVYATNKGVRGYYRVYNKAKKKLLYLLGKKLYSYSKPYLKNSSRFYGIYPIDEQEYRAKKLQVLQDEEKEIKIDKYALKFAVLARWLKQDFNIPYKKIVLLLKENNQPVDDSTMSRLVQKLPENP